MAEEKEPQLVEFYSVTEQEYFSNPIKENALYFLTNGRLFKGGMEISPRDSIITYDSFYSFPSVGKLNTLYIDKGTNKSYRWDGTLLHYTCIGSDYEDIQIINGNGL